MNVTDFVAALRRRWLVVLLGLALTVGLTGAAYEFTKPTYEITGSLLLLPPRSTTGSEVDNPYLQLEGLRQAVDLLGVSLSDQATQLQLQAMSRDVEFTVQANPSIASPLLVIDVKDSSAASATRIRDLLMDRAPVRLKEMQAALGVSLVDQVTSTVVTRDATALEVGRNRLRAGVVAAAVGLASTLSAVALWDAHRLRHPKHRGRPRARGRNHRSRRGSDTDTAPGADSAADRRRATTADESHGALERMSPSALHDDLGEPVGAPDNRR